MLATTGKNYTLYSLLQNFDQHGAKNLTLRPLLRLGKPHVAAGWALKEESS